MPNNGAHEAKERAAEAYRLHRLHVPYREIARRMGYANTSSVSKAIRRAMRDDVPEYSRDVLVGFCDDQLADLYVQAMRVVAQPQALVHNGRVVFQRNDDGELIRDPVSGNPLPVADQRVVVRALDVLLRIQESRRSLLGLDAPARHRVAVVPDDALDDEERRLVQLLGGDDEVRRQLAALDAQSRPAIGAGVNNAPGVNNPAPEPG